MGGREIVWRSIIKNADTLVKSTVNSDKVMAAHPTYEGVFGTVGFYSLYIPIMDDSLIS